MVNLLGIVFDASVGQNAAYYPDIFTVDLGFSPPSRFLGNFVQYPASVKLYIYRV